MPVKVIILVLFGIFQQDDGHSAPSTYVLGFDTLEHCEQGYATVEQKASEQKELRNLGHVCVEVTANPVNTSPI